jgi:hypothetical protein
MDLDALRRIEIHTHFAREATGGAGEVATSGRNHGAGCI